MKEYGWTGGKNRNRKWINGAKIVIKLPELLKILELIMARTPVTEFVHIY